MTMIRGKFGKAMTFPAQPNPGLETSGFMRMVQLGQHPGLEPLRVNFLVNLHLLEENQVRHPFAQKPVQGATSGLISAGQVNQHGIPMRDSQWRSCVLS